MLIEKKGKRLLTRLENSTSRRSLITQLTNYSLFVWDKWECLAWCPTTSVVILEEKKEDGNPHLGLSVSRW